MLSTKPLWKPVQSFNHFSVLLHHNPLFLLTHLFSFTLAGLIGGVAMAIGALTWGRRILKTVAFDVVKINLTMASAAQGVQALVVLAAVSQGFFTSMN